MAGSIDVLSSPDGALANPYARDKTFWAGYLKGRPQAPEAFFERIYEYHASHGGHFGIIHDAGAGVAPHARRLKQKFEHVIVSDIILENVQQASERLGPEGFSYRTAKLEDAEGIKPGSVDMFFAATCMHFCDLDLAQKAIARQLKPGGTFVCAGYGVAVFADEDVNAIAEKFWFEALRVSLRHAPSPEVAAIKLQRRGRAHAEYDFARTDEEYFEGGALRIKLISPPVGREAWYQMVPPDLAEAGKYERSSAGPNDVHCVEEMQGWAFETDLQGIKDQLASLAFPKEEPAAFDGLWREMEEVMKDGRRVKGWWPSRLILATRK
ncbi:hypothetical protein LTR10_000073 [Elasticomyces elasticus]|nr:hypothetical protein LTR10_000073 [Elasticomyces elasticus]KAK4980668.1 hypothetical protein LTR42_000977 [Elasticomyces elasticus]